METTYEIDILEDNTIVFKNKEVEVVREELVNRRS